MDSVRFPTPLAFEGYKGRPCEQCNKPISEHKSTDENIPYGWVDLDVNGVVTACSNQEQGEVK